MLSIYSKLLLIDPILKAQLLW